MSDSIHIVDYDTIIREVLATGGEFRLYPHGTSMLPLIRQGKDSVALKALGRSPRKHDILFYQRADGSYVLHRVKEVSSTGLTLWGDNQYLLEHGVTDDQIIGYAARVFRADKEIDLQSVGYHLYLHIWQCRILRRVMVPIMYRFRCIREKLK